MTTKNAYCQACHHLIPMEAVEAHAHTNPARPDGWHTVTCPNCGSHKIVMSATWLTPQQLAEAIA